MARVLTLIYFVFLVINIVSAFALPFEGLFKLDIIHYNDFHARFEETSVATPTCRFNNNSCLGGLPRLVYEIHTLLKEKPDALLLNAGDSFQGTYWYTLLKWNITSQFMNLLPHDAHAIGNHEFDDGPEGLAPYLSHLLAPVVAANMDVSREPVLQGLFQPHVVVERKGRKIGIIGLITQDTKKLSSPGNVEFTDPGEATKREAELLTQKGVDIIILLSHCGLDIDKQLARDYGQYIDVIIGGHTHSLLWNGPSPSNETVAGPYPIFIENADSKKQVMIVQASAFTKYMGNLSLYFDFRGHYVKYEGGPIFLDRSIPEDEEIKAKLAPYAQRVHEAENVPVGEITSTLTSDDCVYGECALGDMLVDAFNDLGKATIQSTKAFLSFIQRGNIKSTLLEGTITKGEIFELLPYNDRIETFELQGKYVLDALERSVKGAWDYHPFKGPWVLQVSGLQVTYNISQPEGSRVTSVLIQHEPDKQPQPFHMDTLYQVTAPAYLADGGDGFTMFKEGKHNVQVIGRDQSCVEAYIKKHSPLNVTTDGRIKINA
ncbi:apyrase-like [Pectinophora gossypiella]|uniref:apyrase-like n=1 Tax=Pectinophora gossypiella TaxID=13191 RepID=UPI00214F1989|nr:apyrase-like [Pectinophora gossypiella]XP_049879455.1 apyrase-like [Pectinophora gossypiella]